MKVFCQLQRKQTRYRTQRNERKKHNFFGYHPEIFLPFLFSFSLLESPPLAPLCPDNGSSLFFSWESRVRAGHKKEEKRKGERSSVPIGNGLNGAKRKNQDLEIPPLLVNPFPEREKVICTKISISDYKRATPNLPEREMATSLIFGGKKAKMRRHVLFP